MHNAAITFLYRFLFKHMLSILLEMEIYIYIYIYGISGSYNYSCLNFEELTFNFKSIK